MPIFGKVIILYITRHIYTTYLIHVCVKYTWYMYVWNIKVLLGMVTEILPGNKISTLPAVRPPDHPDGQLFPKPTTIPVSLWLRVKISWRHFNNHTHYTKLSQQCKKMLLTLEKIPITFTMHFVDSTYLYLRHLCSLWLYSNFCCLISSWS